MTGTTDISETERILRVVIEKHLPSAAERLHDGETSGTMSAYYAARLNEASKVPLTAFGLGPSVEKWEKLRRSARQFCDALDEIGIQGIREVALYAPPWWDSELPLGHEARFLAELVGEVAVDLERKAKSSPAVGAKRDWKAAALAKVAREIWAENEWFSNPAVYGERPPNSLGDLLLPPHERVEARDIRRAYHRHVSSFAPRSDKHDGPGPFGRFLADILSALSVGSSPASALRSLKDAENWVRERLQ